MKIVDNGSDIILTGYLTDNKNDIVVNALVRVFEEHTLLNTGYTDDKGHFKITITTTGVGIRHLRIVFDGNENYNCSELTDIDVTVREPSIVSKLKLETDKNSCQLSERILLTATCKSQYDELLKDIPITFKADNNVLEVVTTNNEGTARLKVTPDHEGEIVYSANAANEVSSNNVKITVIKGNLYEVIADLNEKLDNCSGGSSDIHIEDLDVDFDYYFGNPLFDEDFMNIDIFLKKVSGD